MSLKSKSKPKRCRNCNAEFYPRNSLQKACSYKCAVILGRVNQAKREKREWKKKNELSENKTKLQAEVNKIVRLIDNGQPCLAKGNYPSQMHAGHIFSRGSSPEIRYNLHNIHRQSAQSNHFQNEDGLLRAKLKQEYGERYFEFIEGLRCYPVVKYDAYTYYGFYLQARKIYRDLEKEITKPLSLSDRIRYRNEANMMIGFYPPECWIFNL